MEQSPASIPSFLRARARGAVSNEDSRYHATRTEYDDDGWDIEEDQKLLKTEVSTEVPRTILTKNTSPDLSFDVSINPYRGCEHGCTYCFARPTHAYLGLSPGLDFETRLIARPDAARVLKAELSARGYQPKNIAIGTNTDPYQPIETKYRIMRQILEVLLEFQHPVTIVTKGTLIERDLDIIADLAGQGLVKVGVSITSLDRQVSRLMEPRAPAPLRRLQMIEKLASVGCPVRVMVAPVVPGLTDHEMEGILERAKDAGAQAAEWIMLRLPAEVSPLFQEWLAASFPDRAGKIMNRVREMHGGKDYSAEWGKRMRGEGEYADMIGKRFNIATKRLGLLQKLAPMRTDLFQVPGRAVQMSLF